MKRSRVNPKSTKTAARDARYATERAAFLAIRRRCEIEWERCTLWATDIHHMQGRLPSVFFDQTKWKPACRSCHTLVTDNPGRAFAAGMSLHRNRVES